jgi:hypothetical protein
MVHLPENMHHIKLLHLNPLLNITIHGLSNCWLVKFLWFSKAKSTSRISGILILGSFEVIISEPVTQV